MGRRRPDPGGLAVSWPNTFSSASDHEAIGEIHMFKRLAALLLLVSVASAAIDLTGQSGLDVLRSLNQADQAGLGNETDILNQTNKTLQLYQNASRNLIAPEFALNLTPSQSFSGSNLWSWGNIPLGYKLTDGQLTPGEQVENLSKMETPSQALESTGAYL